MKQISVAELIPGMVTAQNIFSHNGRTIVPPNVILTDNIISRLYGYSICYVYIEDELESGFSASMADAALQGSEAMAKSRQLKRFSQAFARCAEHYEGRLIKSMRWGEAFPVNELLKETIALLYHDKQEISLFDMLLSRRNHASAIYNHCIDVALISNMLARWLNFSEADQLMATACGFFHDIGKLVLPTWILQKHGKLTADEFAIAQTHTTEGFHMIGMFPAIPEPVKNTALMHHERCDGSGYPYGLSGNEIDKFTKIVTIADIFDTLVNNRTHYGTMCPSSVIKFFEDDGIQKYEVNYLLTFLENMANSFLERKVMLSRGMDGNAIFINRNAFPEAAVLIENNDALSRYGSYYKNMMGLVNNKKLSVEAIQ